jgi:putative colanic acid biosynthesis acetyltransferase WcaF
MVDIRQNRNAQKWTPREKFGRLLWSLTQPLFRLSPRPFWAWRRFLLRLFGAKIGADVHVYPTVRLAVPWNLTVGDEAAIGDHAIIYALGPIVIGAKTTISQFAHLCAGTHDWRHPSMTLLKPPITIGAEVWICADAFIGPNVEIGDRAIIGARSVVMKNVATGSIGNGNPYRVTKQRDQAT